VIEGSGDFTFNGPGTLSVTAANTYGGDTIVSGGTLQIGNGSTTGTLTKLGSESLTLTGANTFAGGTTLSAGSILAGNNAAFGTGSVTIGASGVTLGTTADRTLTNAIDLANNAIIDSDAHAMTLSGVISGAGTFEKAGTGSVTLSGANTFSGGLTVSAGTLATSAASRLASSLAPSVASGATFAYEVDSTDLGALGTAADLLVVNGNLSIDNASVLSFADIGSQPGQFVQDTTVFAMINYTGTWNGGTFTYNSQPLTDGSCFFAGGQMWEIDYNATSGGLNYTADYQPSSSFVTVTAVPEPSTYVMLAIAAGIGAIAARRRRTAA